MSPYRKRHANTCSGSPSFGSAGMGGIERRLESDLLQQETSKNRDFDRVLELTRRSVEVGEQPLPHGAIVALEKLQAQEMLRTDLVETVPLPILERRLDMWSRGRLSLSKACLSWPA